MGVDKNDFACDFISHWPLRGINTFSFQLVVLLVDYPNHSICLDNSFTAKFLQNASDFLSF